MYTVNADCTVNFATVARAVTQSTTSNTWAYDIGCPIASCGAVGGVPLVAAIAARALDPADAFQRGCQAFCNGVTLCIGYAYSTATSLCYALTLTQTLSLTSGSTYTYYDYTCSYDRTASVPASTTNCPATIQPNSNYVITFATVNLATCKTLCTSTWSCRSYYISIGLCYLSYANTAAMLGTGLGAVSGYDNNC